MITPPTKSFFAINISGEAADLVTNMLSPETVSDIREAILVSDDFNEDIEATNRMDATLDKLLLQLGSNICVKTIYNPLYIPSTQDQIDSVLEGDPASENFKFIGMDGNPFIMKSVSITCDNEQVIQARCGCHQFDLPSYSDIIHAQTGRPN